MWKSRDTFKPWWFKDYFGEPPKATEADIRHANAAGWFDDPVPTRHQTWAHRIQQAALEDAVRVLGGSGLMLSTDDFMLDVWWVEGKRKAAPGFSLADICESLDLDHGYVKRKLLELARSTHARHAARREVA